MSPKLPSSYVHRCVVLFVIFIVLFFWLSEFLTFVFANRLARGRDEWESAALQNANTKCNGLLPIWGPQVIHPTESDDQWFKSCRMLLSNDRRNSTCVDASKRAVICWLYLSLRSLSHGILFWKYSGVVHQPLWYKRPALRGVKFNVFLFPYKVSESAFASCLARWVCFFSLYSDHRTVHVLNGRTSTSGTNNKSS